MRRLVFLILTAAAHSAFAQPFDPALLAGLHWRSIGPYRGGRTKAAAGVPSRPGVFYIGAVNGGVWKTDDYGRTWTPLFDAQPTSSIGALAIAASNPDIIYVGSGEGLHRPDLSIGDGIYKSVDAGKTWEHLGLRDAQQIPQIVIDPENPDRLFVAALGHPYGPNEERGIYRSTDGGKSFERVLYKDADTGGADVAFDPSNAQIVYASLWEAREGPWENAEFAGPGSGLYKSIDGGTTWKQIGRGLPGAADGLQRIGIGIAPSRPSRVFVTVHAKKNEGLYRSEDHGESFKRITEDPLIAERADDFAEVKVDPNNSDIVYTASVVVWKSVDGGKKWSALRGAPGGDDYQRIWIDPTRPEVILIASDQGAIITVNGGRTFSSWYNQPTAQMFHATADDAFPYRVCGGQQDSGSACVPSRGPNGRITFRDWQPGGFEEYGYGAPDPLDPEIVYGGKISRRDQRTGQVQHIGPLPLGGSDYRAVRTQPVLFSPIDKHTLYFASNTLWKTTDGGQHWTSISPDLTRPQWEVPANVGKYRGTDEAEVKQRGVIYAVAPSPLDLGTLWAGTDDGLIHLTTDGGAHWTDVTPKELGPWAKVSILEASHFDKLTAYAAINTMRLDEQRPRIYRTRDGGKSWTQIIDGIVDGGIVNVVREDPKRRGLLYAGTEQTVYVSFDDGDHWQSLRLDLPATSIRDLVVKDADLVVATHGRGFYILDDSSPLRQLSDKVAQSSSFLFQPQRALRIRTSTYTDTPLPPDEPGAPNPPDGAVLDYWLGAEAASLTLELLDSNGRLVRKYSSSDPIPPLRDEGNVPRYWIRPAPHLMVTRGAHRFVWDLRYPPPAADKPGFGMTAVPMDTPPEPRGPWVSPGKYQVRLAAGEATHTATLEVVLDPRLHTSIEDLNAQLALSQKLIAAAEKLSSVQAAAKELHGALEKDAKKAELLKQLIELEGIGERRRRGPRSADEPTTLARTQRALGAAYSMMQEADAAPTQQLAAAAEKSIAEVQQLDERLSRVKAEAAK